jgi:hypothetical protein
VEIIPRTSLGLPAKVTRLGGIGQRSPLAPQRPLVIVHYTGVVKAYRFADLAREVQAIHRWKNNEYNWVIHQDGRIGEFAGHYQAAHAAGYNALGYGVLMLNGVGEPCTDAQVASFRWLIGAMKWGQSITANPLIAAHGEAAKTACPGAVWQRIEELRAA